MERKLSFTVSDEILCEIGKIVVFQTTIEVEIGQYISDLLGTDHKKGHIVTAELSFKNLLATLSSLLMGQVGSDSDDYAQFKEVKKGLRAFENFRNSVVHSVWARSRDFDENKALRMKTTAKEKKGLSHQCEEISKTQIVAQLEEAGSIYVKLARLMAKVLGRDIDQSPKIQ